MHSNGVHIVDNDMFGLPTPKELHTVPDSFQVLFLLVVFYLKNVDNVFFIVFPRRTTNTTQHTNKMATIQHIPQGDQHTVSSFCQIPPFFV